MNAHATAATIKNRDSYGRYQKRPTCYECAGLGERDPAMCNHTKHIPNDRTAIRAIFDRDGRWMIHWKEKDGEEWVGTYRLMPC